MDERIPEILIAFTLLMVGIRTIIVDVLNFLGLNVEEIAPALISILSWLLFIFSVATAFVLIKDAIKKRDED